MVTTIHSLPPETLRLILASIDPFYPQIAADLTKSPYSQRYTNLRSAALVCSAWRPMVQEELWRDVCLRDGRAMDAFARVGGLFHVSRVIIEVRWDGTTRCLERILSGLQGVHDLALFNGWSGTNGPQTLDLKCINGVGYRNLKSLCLEGVQLVDTSLELSPIVFALTDLKLWINWPSDPFHAVFARICGPSLRDLSIECETTGCPFTDASTFPSLTTLEYFHTNEFPTPFPHSCTSLQHLSLDYADHLPSIPVPLVTLSIHGTEAAEDLVRMFKNDILALSNLKTLFMPWSTEGPTGEIDRTARHLLSSPAWEEVKKICVAKGIQVRCNKE